MVATRRRIVQPRPACRLNNSEDGEEDHAHAEVRRSLAASKKFAGSRKTSTMSVCTCREGFVYIILEKGLYNLTVTLVLP